MKYYSYVESEDDVNITKVVYSEKEILEEFWQHWSTEMKGNGYPELISYQNCVDDWCAIHWARREDVYRFKNGYGNKLFCINEFNLLDPNLEYATVVCLNDPSVVINGYVSLIRDMEKVDV